MVRFKRQLVSQSVERQRSYGRGNPVNYVVIHQTGNTNVGADAEMHARLQSNLNPRQASWHEQVDDKEAIQSFEDTVRCWAAGDGKKANGGNMTGYHIEICINSDGDYKKAVENGAKRAAAKLKEHGLGIEALKQHADFASKNCPAQIRAGKDGITWAKFVKMVEAELNGGKAEAKSKPKAKSAPKSSSKKTESKPKANGTYSGNSIVDYLVSINQDASFKNRARLAQQHGIRNYRGTAAQNLELLNKLRSGEKPKQAPKKKKLGYTGNSIVDYLRSIGADPSFKNRSRLARQYGIRNYRGTAAQNTELLRKLRGY